MQMVKVRLGLGVDFGICHLEPMQQPHVGKPVHTQEALPVKQRDLAT